MTISAPKAILIWRCIEKIKWHFGQIPSFTNFLSEFVTSVKRIENFLLCDEIETQMTEKLDFNETDVAIEFKTSNFFWGFDLDQKDNEKVKDLKELKSFVSSEVESIPFTEDCMNQTFEDRIALKNINLKIMKGEFVAIIGDVGAGKSSLINSLLGETLYVDDKVLDKYGDKELDYTNDNEDNIPPSIKEIMDARKQNVNESEAKIKIAGSVSLVEQKPFIISKTVRENILFGEDLDKDRYNKTIEICQLARDLEILEGGDLTQIGEKGINLSGGQKARLSIARAVYSNKDIILMDDPLSALDAHVKKSIFDEVCCKELRDRTRVLVTHAVDFLDNVDRIIVIDKGNIILNGTYSELMEHEYFQKIMNTMHKQDKKDEDENIIIADDAKEHTVEKTKNHMNLTEKKLLEQEDDEELEVNFRTYLEYFAFCRNGLIAISISIIIMFIMRYLQMKNDYIILNWVRDFTATGHAEYGTLLFLISLVAGSLILEF
jgi:ATP-binding cassette subfamily C (CFTR/MRP) protein 1